MLVALVVIVFVFAPVRHHGFVAYDDLDFLVNDPHVSGGVTAAGLQWAFAPSTAYAFTGGPLTWLSHMVDFQFFGAAPGPHHIVNVVLHALNTVLLFLLLWRMTGGVGKSAVVAALFAAHPLHVESVAWISERKDVLSTTFWLLTTIAYVGYTRRVGLMRYALVFVLLTLGLMAKPVLATLPFTLLLLDAWPLARAPLVWADRRRWIPLVLEKLPLLVPAAGAMWLTVAAQQQLGAVSSAIALPWSLRLENAVVSYATYLWKMLWPVDLAVFYPYPPDRPVWTGGVSVAVLVALSIVAWRAARTRPYITVGWLWYVATLIPMIGLVQVGSHAMADRYTYVPLIGLFIAVVWGVAEIAASGRLARRLATGLACAAIVASAVTARAQVHTWRDSEALWRQALTVTTGNFRGHAGMAEVLASRGETDAAIAQYKEALRLAPDAAEWHVNLGLLLAGKGEVVDAAFAFRRAVALKPDDAESHNNLGAMLARQGRTQEAVAHYRRSLDLNPAYALARRNLGLAFASEGAVTAGLRECLEALRLSPAEGQWHYEVAVMLLSVERTAEAIGHLQDAVKFSPQHQAAREMLTKLGRE